MSSPHHTGRRETLPSNLRSVRPLQHDVQRGRGNVPDRSSSHTYACFRLCSPILENARHAGNTQQLCDCPLSLAPQDARCGTRYASKRREQRGDSGWAGLSIQSLCLRSTSFNSPKSIWQWHREKPTDIEWNFLTMWINSLCLILTHSTDACPRPPSLPRAPQ